MSIRQKLYNTIQRSAVRTITDQCMQEKIKELTRCLTHKQAKHEILHMKLVCEEGKEELNRTEGSSLSHSAFIHALSAS